MVQYFSALGRKKIFFALGRKVLYHFSALGKKEDTREVLCLELIQQDK